MSRPPVCPHCGREVETNDDSQWCSYCGTPLPASAASQPGGDGQGARADNDPSVNGRLAAAPSPSLSRRYREAYLVARVLDKAGKTIRELGVAVSVILGLLSMVPGSELVFLAGLAVAGFFGLIAWVAGSLLAAQGQILMAAVDTAVAVSPYLKREERWKAMGFKRDPLGDSD